MAEFSTEGFVKDLSSDVVKVNLDRRRYKAEICAEYGGFRGYVIKRETHSSEIAKNADNPDGLFEDIIVRLSRPAPVVNGKDQVERAEIGEDILVVANAGLKGLLPLADDPKFCAEVEVVPLVKEKITGGKSYWRFKIGIRNEKIDKGKVVPELGLLNSFKEDEPKLTDGSAPA